MKTFKICLDDGSFQEVEMIRKCRSVPCGKGDVTLWVTLVFHKIEDEFRGHVWSVSDYRTGSKIPVSPPLMLPTDRSFLDIWRMKVVARLDDLSEDACRRINSLPTINGK